MDFQVLQDPIARPDRSSGHLLALFMQSDGDEPTAMRHARLAASMLEPRAPPLPDNVFKVVGGQRVTLNPALSKDKGYSSLSHFLQSYDTLYRSKDALAASRRAQLFQPFLTDLNVRRSEYLVRDEHCYVQYRSDDELHLFRCFGGTYEPDEVSVLGLVHFDEFHALPPRTAPVPARLAPASSRGAVSDLSKSHPTRATAVEGIDAWLREFGYDPDALTKEDYAALTALLKANVASAAIAIKERSSSTNPTKKKKTRPGEDWYETYVRETRSPDVGRVALLKSVAECREAAEVNPSPVKQQQIPEPPPAPQDADADDKDGGPHSTYDLYANIDQYEENATVTLRRFDGRPTYTLKRGVWCRTFSLPIVDKHALQRVALSAGLQAVAERDNKGRRDPRADAAAFSAWSRLQGRMDVYRVSPTQSWMAQESLDVSVSAAEETYDAADNPLFYKPLDPYTDSAPPEASAVDQLVEASHLRLTEKGRTWLGDNLEFYNSEQTFKAQQQQEADKLAATLRALEQSAEWAAASDAKQRDMRDRVRRIGDERLSKAAAEFRSKQALAGAALLSVLLAAAAAAPEYLEGTPELHPLCVPPAEPRKGASVLEQAQAYVVCALQRARLLGGADAASAVRDYAVTILRDKPDLAPSETPMWKAHAEEEPSKRKSAALLGLASAHVSAARAGAVLEPSGRDARPSVRAEEDLQLRSGGGGARKHVHRVSDVSTGPTEDEQGSLLRAVGAESPQDILQRAKRALLDLQVPAAGSLQTLTERHATLSTFLRSEFLGLLGRVAHGYKAETTVFRKRYLAPEVQRAVEDTLASENGVLQPFATRESETFRKHVQRILDAMPPASSAESAVTLFSAAVLAVCNIPPGKDAAFPPKAMVAQTVLSDADRAKKAALLTHVMQHLVAFVRASHSDIDALRSSKVEAREKRDANLRAKYESLDPEMKQTIGVFRKLNFKDWKDFVLTGENEEHDDNDDENTIQLLPEEEEEADEDDQADDEEA